MIESNEVSAHQVRIYQAVLKMQGWKTSRDISELAEVAPRTARLHLLNFVKLGILDQAELFPGHRYRLSKVAAKRNKAYIQRLENAAEVFGQH